VEKKTPLNKDERATGTAAGSLTSDRRLIQPTHVCKLSGGLRPENTWEATVMSHHYSGPDVGFPHGDARLDLTDVYAFPKPGGGDKSILIMNVHPSSTLRPPGRTRLDPFATDIAYRVRFSPFANGLQTATLRRAEGTRARETDDGGQTIMAGAPVSMRREAQITEAAGYRFFAGWRSDPFFFDPLGALNNFQFTVDHFTDEDVCSIVLEVPNSALGSGQIGIWARTLDGKTGSWVQADRGGLPAQAVFLPGDDRDAYLLAEPANDARFIGSFAHSLEHTGGYSTSEARRVASTLLPDILRFEPTRPASYPDNGRSLTDDVIDHFLAIITNGRVTTDGIGPHTDLLVEFPYLGAPHQKSPAQ
jgi:hypothetical protein